MFRVFCSWKALLLMLVTLGKYVPYIEAVLFRNSLSGEDDLELIFGYLKKKVTYLNQNVIFLFGIYWD